MTKKQYNDNPTTISEALDIIKALKIELTNSETQLEQVKQERDQKNQAWQTISAELDQEKAKNNHNNTKLTEEELIAQAQALGMKTKEEYQAGQKVKDAPESENISPLWLLTLIFPVLLWGWFKHKKS